MGGTVRLLARAEVDGETGAVDLPFLEQAGVPDGPRGNDQRVRRLILTHRVVSERVDLERCVALSELMNPRTVRLLNRISRIVPGR